jgi:hypothetical protein
MQAFVSTERKLAGSGTRHATSYKLRRIPTVRLQRQLNVQKATRAANAAAPQQRTELVSSRLQQQASTARILSSVRRVHLGRASSSEHVEGAVADNVSNAGLLPSIALLSDANYDQSGRSGESIQLGRRVSAGQKVFPSWRFCWSRPPCQANVWRNVSRAPALARFREGQRVETPCPGRPPFSLTTRLSNV